MLDKYIYRHMTHSHSQFYNSHSLSLDRLGLFLEMDIFLLHTSVQKDELKESTEMKWQLHDSEKLK